MKRRAERRVSVNPGKSINLWGREYVFALSASLSRAKERYQPLIESPAGASLAAPDVCVDQVFDNR